MFQKAYFQKDIPREEIVKIMRDEGFEPKLIIDKPNFIYQSHLHAETKLIVCLEGSMKVIVKGKEYHFEPGDKLKIPGNAPHSGRVGPKGCIYYWSEKILE